VKIVVAGSLAIGARAGRVGQLLTPDNCDPRYQTHLDAEVRRSIVFGVEKKMKEKLATNATNNTN
jgi:hypothetical protein